MDWIQKEFGQKNFSHSTQPTKIISNEISVCIRNLSNKSGLGDLTLGSPDTASKVVKSDSKIIKKGLGDFVWG